MALARGRTSFVPRLPEGSAVKLIGLGGVGGIVARYLALFLASLGIRLRMVLIDGDEFEAKNAQRMYFRAEGNKAVVVLQELKQFLRDSSLELSAIEEHVTAENLEKLIHEGDLVVLAVDNHVTRKLVSDFCGTRQNIVLFSGGNDGVGPDSTGAVRPQPWRATRCSTMTRSVTPCRGSLGCSWLIGRRRRTPRLVRRGIAVP